VLYKVSSFKSLFTVNMKKIITKSPEETIKLGKSIGKKLKGNETICLVGKLGSGKTQFVKGVALGLGIKENITSPSFVIVKIYNGKVNLIHIDFYRLEDKSELETIGFDDFFSPNNIIVIEWADRFKDIYPDYATWINIKYIDETTREFHINASI